MHTFLQRGVSTLYLPNSCCLNSAPPVCWTRTSELPRYRCSSEKWGHSGASWQKCTKKDYSHLLVYNGKQQTLIYLIVLTRALSTSIYWIFQRAHRPPCLEPCWYSDPTSSGGQGSYAELRPDVCSPPPQCCTVKVYNDRNSISKQQDKNAKRYL